MFGTFHRYSSPMLTGLPISPGNEKPIPCTCQVVAGVLSGPSREKALASAIDPINSARIQSFFDFRIALVLTAPATLDNTRRSKCLRLALNQSFRPQSAAL